jgi:hypothetical protein
MGGAALNVYHVSLAQSGLQSLFLGCSLMITLVAPTGPAGNFPAITAAEGSLFPPQQQQQGPQQCSIRTTHSYQQQGRQHPTRAAGIF